MEIKLGAFGAKDLDVVKFGNPEQQQNYHKFDTILTVSEKDFGVTVLFDITYHHFNIESLDHTIFKSETTFHITGKDLKYLHSATNADTIELMCDLAQTAMGHSRALLLINCMDNEIPEIIMPFMHRKALEPMVRESLLSQLN